MFQESSVSQRCRRNISRGPSKPQVIPTDKITRKTWNLIGPGQGPWPELTALPLPLTASRHDCNAQSDLIILPYPKLRKSEKVTAHFFRSDTRQKHQVMNGQQYRFTVGARKPCKPSLLSICRRSMSAFAISFLQSADNGDPLPDVAADRSLALSSANSTRLVSMGLQHLYLSAFLIPDFCPRSFS